MFECERVSEWSEWEKRQKKLHVYDPYGNKKLLAQAFWYFSSHIHLYIELFQQQQQRKLWTEKTANSNQKHNQQHKRNSSSSSNNMRSINLINKHSHRMVLLLLRQKATTEGGIEDRTHSEEKFTAHREEHIQSIWCKSNNNGKPMKLMIVLRALSFSLCKWVSTQHKLKQEIVKRKKKIIIQTACFSLQHVDDVDGGGEELL